MSPVEPPRLLELFARSASPGGRARTELPWRPARVPLRDIEADARVAVIDQTLAERLWPDRDAVGQRLRLNGEHEIVGVWPTTLAEHISLFSFPQRIAASVIGSFAIVGCCSQPSVFMVC